MMPINAFSRVFLLLLVLGLLGAAPAALAATQSDAAPRQKPQRPVYLDIVPVADAGDSMLSAEDVASFANEALSKARQATIRMNGQDLPAGVRVLRIMYIVHRQNEDDGVTAAVAASTELLRTAEEGDGGLQTFSIYNGLQQTLVQGPDAERAREQLRRGFKNELQARISSAFQHPEAL